jgi:CMP-N,N'-diacetyllegionaminic acid synthase
VTCLGVILARGASKRLPRKNVRELCGTPLVAWSCRAALASSIDRVIVSTEDAEIAAIASYNGVAAPFERPAALAADFADDIDILIHALDACEQLFAERYDEIILIQATTPYVQPGHFDACLNKLREGNYACVFSARKVEDHPRWVWTTDSEDRARPFMGRPLSQDEHHGQNLTPAFYPTGAAWAARVAPLRDQRAVYCEPLGLVETDWRHAIDIDDERDWMFAEAVGRAYEMTPAGEMKRG